MVKQTAVNNAFLKEMKAKYNEPIFKRATSLVNDGKEGVAKYWVASNLCGIANGEHVAEKLLNAGVPVKRAKTPEDVDKLFEKARSL